MKGVMIRIWICLLALGLTLYAIVERQNRHREIQFMLPKLRKEYINLKEVNEEISFELRSQEHPLRLYHLLREKEFGDLRFPMRSEEIHLNSSRGDIE